MNDRIGSLCTGAAGLDMAVEAVFGGVTVWQSEVDPAASRVLAYRYPNVPNLGDLTAVDWDTVPPVDILTAGYPCQPFSHAGRRKGTDDARHLWPHVAEAVRRIRPRHAVFENVAGHRSLGFDSVLGELAAARYDVRWCSVRASDVGAPHRRERLFIVATDAQPEHGRQGRAHGQLAGRGSAVDAHSTRDGRDEGWPESAGVVGGSDAPVSGTTLADSEGGSGCVGYGDDVRAGGGPQRRGSAAGGSATPDTDRDGHARVGGELAGERDADGRDSADVAWGAYEPAIRRWERALGRSAPAPTEPNSRGGQRLSPRFVEWLMGWPAGWVTDAPDISRNDQLKICGNGVVPQQAAHALRLLSSIDASMRGVA